MFLHAITLTQQRLGPITWGAMSSWLEKNSEYDYLYFLDDAAARYVEQWQPSTVAIPSNYSVPKARPACLHLSDSQVVRS